MFQILIKVFIIFFLLIGSVAYLVYAERKIAGYIQERYGPNRVGPFGLLQPVADILKLFFKEEIFPTNRLSLLYILAPVIVITAAILPFAVLPFTEGFYITDINVGVLYLIAVMLFGIYGVILAGISSGSKYSLIGGLRASAQLISYEIAIGLSLIGVVIMAGSMSLVDIVKAQRTVPFIIPQFLGFLVFLIAGFAETNRLPFDLPEAESELVGGYHTEYSSIKFALFFLGEYINIILLSSLIVVMYLGGWMGPVLPSGIWFILKLVPFIFLFIWIRWTYPRFRFDQLMDIGWKFLIPLGLFNIFVASLIKIFVI